MDGEASKGLHILAIGFTAFIFVVFSYVCLRTVTRQLLFKNIWIENVNEEPKNETIEIEWQSLYPFSRSEPADDEGMTFSKIDWIKNYIGSIENRIASDVTEFLPFYRTVTELAGYYEQLVLWNFSNYSEYNNVIIRDGGYLINIYDRKNTPEIAEAVMKLADFCTSEDVEFVYIEYPSKICVYEDSDISGTMDFSNQNADEFLNELNNHGVLTYDLRTVLHEEELNHHSLFFNTDHHWKPQAGLWASQHILDFLNRSLDCNFNAEILDSRYYYEHVYENWFLGSQGKKVTLSGCNPDDISLIYPKYETSIHYEIPSLSIDEYGGFDITYCMENIAEKDYYNNNPYAAYNYSDQPLIRIENELIDEEAHVLIIHNSFSNCVIPFLAMGIKNVDAIDLRYFTGSLQSYISQEKPDIVIAAYQTAPGVLTTQNFY